MGDIQHELSWSTSRARSFERCARQYYWQYYGSWRGWTWDASPERRQAHMLKKMTRMPILAGTIVHNALARYYDRRRQGLELPGLKDLSSWCRDQLREAFRQSLSGGWERRPGKVVHLAEHQYSEPEVEPRTEALKAYGKRYVDKMAASIETFLTAEATGPMRDAPPETWLAVDPVEDAFDRSRGFEWSGLHVFAFPDFAWRGDDGRVHIVDWKTGAQTEADIFQLQVYTLAARELWGTNPEQVTTYCAYLVDGTVKTQDQSPEALEETIEAMERSMSAMRAVHYDPDQQTSDQREAFPQIDANGPEAGTCHRCNFRQLCDR